MAMATPRNRIDIRLTQLYRRIVTALTVERDNWEGSMDIREAQIAYDARLPDDGPDLIDLACQRYLENADGMSELVTKAMGREKLDEAFVALMSRNDPQPLQNVIAEAFEAVTGFNRSYAGWSEK